MAWALVVALAVVGVWLWSRRQRGPRIVAPRGDAIVVPDRADSRGASLGAGPADAAIPDGGARPLSRRSADTGVDARMLLDAFRADEIPVPEDDARNDQLLMVRILQLLAEYTSAHEAVLWEPFEGDGDRVVAAAWSRGAEPPALPESDRAIVELAASEQRQLTNPSGPFLRLAASGIRMYSSNGAVSVHFREEPVLSRDEILSRLDRMSLEVAARHELLHTRATLAIRVKRLRSTIRTAMTLQGSLEPGKLERVLVDDACLVTGADWGVLVRGSREGRPPAVVAASGRAPEVFRPTASPALEVRQGTVVGEVFRTGRPRVTSDTRPMIEAQEPVFAGTPLPEGTRALVVVPIRRSEKATILGVLVLGSSVRNGFSNSDSHAAGDLGTIAAGALDSAWAWQDATRSARTDQLTGLPNRRAFDEEFRAMVEETDRFGNEAALVIADVDFFKKVNDTYGHEAGDDVLKAVGAALTKLKRATDKVARLGGEELAILLPQTNREGALLAAERCRRAIEDLTVRTGAGEVRVTASFGVAMYSARSGGSGSLFDRADQALYRAKHGGRNRVVVDGE